MRYTNGATAYKEAKVLGSSPEQLVVLLYDHLLSCLRRAALHVRSDDTEGRISSLELASDVVFELLSALDVEAGGELARKLGALYAWFISEISAISREPDPARLERLTTIVVSLHESWERAAVAAAGARTPGRES
jgi:flagellar secretion chaperone FliS